MCTKTITLPRALKIKTPSSLFTQFMKKTRTNWQSSTATKHEVYFWSVASFNRKLKGFTLILKYILQNKATVVIGLILVTCW